MEATGDQEGGNSEDLTGKKKPKLQILKSRLFGKMKRKGNEGVMKQSQSASDIMEGIWNLEDDFHCSQSMLGSRALSHDSIFLADECQSDPEPPRVLSQENIHGKIRALQMKLQQQNMHLGPPPLVLHIKRTEDPGGSSEDDGLPHSPPEILGLPKNMPYKSPMQPSSQPVSPQPVSPTPALVSPSVPAPGLDFNTLPQFVPCLDNSAARHRMSIKPRNQRASTKNRRLPTSVGCRPRSESMNNLERPLTESEEEEGAAVTKEMTRVRSYSSQIIRPGEVLSTLPIKSPLSVSPLKSLVGAGDGNATRAKNQPEASSSGTNTLFQHHVLKQQTPAREAVSSQKPEAATAALVPKQAPYSAVPVPKTWSGELRETPYSSTLKSAQDSTVSTVTSSNSTARVSSVGFEQNQPQVEKRSNTIPYHDKRDTLIKDIMNEDHARGLFPQASAGGVALRPLSLRRNTSPLDDKVVARNLQQISSAPLPEQGDQLQKRSADHQKPVSGSFRFSVSSDKSHERHRTGSFTGVMAPTGAKREPAQEQLESVQARPIRKDPLSFTEYQANETRAAGTLAVTRPRDPTASISAGRERGDSQASESQETGVEATEEEVQEGIEEADEASEDLKGNDANEEEKEEEERNAFGVKLRTTNLSLKFRTDKAQSELRVKQHSAGVSSLNPPRLMESTTPAAEGQKGSSVGPIKGNMAGTVSKKSPVHNTEALISAQVSSRDKESTAPIRLDDVGAPAQHSSQHVKSTKFVHSLPKESTPVSSASEESAPVSLSTKGFTPVCSVENTPIPTAAKQPQESSSELSWMSMAREKTRSLQQLFTSRLPDFSSLQTTTRSMNMTAAPPQTQTSTSQPSVGPLKTISTQPSDMPASPRATFTAQPSGMQSSVRSSEPTAGQSGAADFSLKRSTSQTQTELSVRAGQLPASRQSAITHSLPNSAQGTATYISAPQFNPQTVHTAKQQLSQPLSQAQSQASQGTTQSNLRSTQLSCLQLSSSPKLTSHQASQESVSVLLQSRAQMVGDVVPTPLVKVNRTPVLQGKGPVEGRTQWAGGLGSKALLAERWENRAPDTTKVEDQKSTTESRPAPLAAFRAMSSPSNITESAASSASMRLDREDKWPKKTVPPSSSPSSSSSPPQSIGDSEQPSWMELAKRKSLAWSDKTMD
ncbi:uncharacterized protein cracdla isoform X2 [Salminus brasiliensis]|uniref:uncharacterized protein cracdla isoform X2 n=1 Tax=Salminus brasiliensis TaxID=930266 RepID=UPI003B837FC1